MKLIITDILVLDYLIVTVIIMFTLLGLLEWLKPNSSIRGELKDTKEEIQDL